MEAFSYINFEEEFLFLISIFQKNFGVPFSILKNGFSKKGYGGLERDKISLLRKCLGLVYGMSRTLSRSSDVGFANARGPKHTMPGTAIDFELFQPNRASNPARS